MDSSVAKVVCVGFRVWGLWHKASGSGFRVMGLGFSGTFQGLANQSASKALGAYSWTLELNPKP